MRKKTENRSDHVCGRRCRTQVLKARLKVVHSDVSIGLDLLQTCAVLDSNSLLAVIYVMNGSREGRGKGRKESYNRC